MTADPASFLPLRADVLLILLVLGEEPLHGYAIMRDVEDRTEGEVQLQTGALYRALKQLLRTGLIEECDPPAHEAAEDERRRYYRTTRLGAAVVDAEVDRMARLVRAARASRRDPARRPRFA